MTLLAEDHLSFGFNIQTSQLIAHPVQCLIHFRQGSSKIADLFFQTTAPNGGLASEVYQAVQQIGRYLYKLGRCFALLRHSRWCALWRRLNFFAGKWHDGQLRVFSFSIG